MKSRIEGGFIEYCLARKKTILLLVGLAALVTVALFFAGQKTEYDIMNSENGEFVLVDLSEAPNHQIILAVRGELGETSVERQVTIKHGVSKENVANDVISDSEMVSMELSRIVRDINRGEGDIVELPVISPEGIKLTWNVPQKGKEFLVPLMLPLIVMFYLYRGERDKKLSEDKRERTEIVRELPRFNNKLVLLMESGLIYEEALERICNAGTQGTIEKLFSKSIEESKLMNGYVERFIGDYAREKKVSELSRLISIVTESRERGTDLREKLVAEGKILWEKRKRQAEEQGKLADTKLAFPLGMMLISLLLVTAAPALMQF